MDISGLLLSIAASPLSIFINTTNGAFAVVEAFHIVAIALVFGTIFIVDLRLIGYPAAHRPFTEIAAETLKWTWVGFALAVVTGALLFITNPVFYYENFEFRMKMLLLLLAGVNMAVFEFYTVRSVANWNVDAPVPLAGRVAGTLSMLFWLGVIVFGRLIGFAASAMQDPFASL